MMRWLTSLPTHTYSSEGMMELQNNRDLNSTPETKVKVKHEDEGEEISSNDNATVSSEVKTEMDCKTEPANEEA